MSTKRSVEQNLLVASLPGDERLEIVRLMEPVDLPVRTPLVPNDGREPSVYFLTSGLASIIVTLANGTAVETVAIGAEGWIGLDLFAGAMPGSAAVFQQIPGAGLRMTNGNFEKALLSSRAFATSISRFHGVVLSHSVQTAACNRIHDANARCARWLLFTRDRVGQSELGITQEFLGQMLGASRSSVASTLARFTDLGLIEHSRANVVVKDVRGLRRISCECHEVLAGVYERYAASLGRD